MKEKITTIDEAWVENNLAKGQTKIIIPQGVIRIVAGAFSGCEHLTEIVIPEGVRHIGDDVFSECKALTHLSIPKGVTYLGGKVFSGYSGLANLSVPANLGLWFYRKILDRNITIIRRGIWRIPRLPKGFFTWTFQRFDIDEKPNRFISLALFLCCKRVALDSESKIPGIPSEMILSILSHCKEEIASPKEAKVEEDPSILKPSLFLK